MKITGIKVGSLVKILTVVYTAFGLIMGTVLAVMKAMGAEASPETQQMGYVAILLFPVLYAAIGALSGLIIAFFFNLATLWVGPLEVDTEADQRVPLRVS